MEAVGEALVSVWNWTADAVESFFGTVICSELCRQGLMNHATYAADVAYGKLLSREYPLVMKGYRFLAAPIVRAMQSSRIFAEIVSVIARPWAHEMVFQMGVGSSGSLIGKLMMAVGTPVCGLVGVFLSDVAHGAPAAHITATNVTPQPPNTPMLPCYAGTMPVVGLRNDEHAKHVAHTAATLIAKRGPT